MASPVIVSLANDFPPGLNTAAPPSDLKANETPESYGFDLTVDGKIKTGSVPTGTSRVQKSYNITESGSSIPYLWHGRRLWNITNRTASTASNVLQFGALDYNDVFYPPSTRFHKINFVEDTETIKAILPVEPDSIFVAKATGGYMIRNISDTRGYFQVSDLIQEMACSAAARAIVINNVVYVGNSDGIIAYRNMQTQEISRNIRPTRATVGALTLTADYERNWLILGTTYVFDAARDRWFNFSSTSFRFTTRTLRNPDWSPFGPETLYFSIEHGAVGTGYLTYQVKYEDENWSTAYNVNLPYEDDKFSLVKEMLPMARSTRRFAVRVTSLSSTKYLREIQLEAEGLRRVFPPRIDDYST